MSTNLRPLARLYLAISLRKVGLRKARLAISLMCGGTLLVLGFSLSQYAHQHISTQTQAKAQPPSTQPLLSLEPGETRYIAAWREQHRGALELLDVHLKGPPIDLGPIYLGQTGWGLPQDAQTHRSGTKSAANVNRTLRNDRNVGAPISVWESFWHLALGEVSPRASSTSGFIPNSPKLRLSKRDIFGRWHPAHSPARLVLLRFRSPDTAGHALRQAQQRGWLAFAEADSLHALSQANEFEDIGLNLQQNSTWWQKSIGLPDAYAQLTKLYSGLSLTQAQTEPPVIAVLDSGVDIAHPSLRSQIWENLKAGSTLCGQDRFGCDTTLASSGNRLGEPRSQPFGTQAAGQACRNLEREDDLSNCVHGTHVAGLIAAQPSVDPVSRQSLSGVCPTCKIYPIRVVEEVGGFGRVKDSSILAAMRYISLLDRSGPSRIRILNSSFGKFEFKRSVKYWVERLGKLSGGGVLVVGAAGNEDSVKASFPAGFDNALAVASLTASGAKSRFSNFGSWVDIAAPGGGGCVNSALCASIGDQPEAQTQARLLSTVPGGLFLPFAGTSMAAPVVAGVAGLLAGLEPELTAAEIKGRLMTTADPSIYSRDSNLGYNHRYYLRQSERLRRAVPLLGTGRVDALAALSNQRQGFQEVPRRVRPGCGVIGLSRQTASAEQILTGAVREKWPGKSAHTLIWLFLLSLPCWCLLLKRKVPLCQTNLQHHLVERKPSSSAC